MLDVCLLGTGGMMPLPNRWLTSLMLRYNGSGLLIDCGEGTQISIRQKGWSFHGLDVICFTHYHGDHISGLPGLLLSMGNAQRTEPVTLIGPKGLVSVVSALRTIAPELPYELRFIELENKEEIININGYEICAFRVKHNVTCYGYSIKINRVGRFMPEKAKELGIPVQSWSILQKGENYIVDGKEYTPDMVLGPKRKGIKLVYCTDTRPTNGIIEHADSADLFICEGMYGEKDKILKAKENKHMTFYEAAEIAEKARVRELWLTHYSPSLTYPEEYKKEVRKIFANTKVPRDRRTTILEFDKDE